ncbi:MAG: lamin tail domain-containing protein, partial [Clostridia bacterium]|nr:lamin tail domain-containing protein [Clostridia bacterium]
EVYRTEDADLGWYVTLEKNGGTIVNAQIRHSREASLKLESVSRENQMVVIRNTGDTMDLGGCFLYSERGNEVFIFPQNTILPAGESITLGCVGIPADLIWTGETGAWHKSKEDRAILYDRWGNVLDTRFAE